jgi:O-antigen/teichoic acid export membrane protein
LLSCHDSANAETEGRLRQAVHLNALIAIEAGIFLLVLADWIMRLMVPGATSLDILGLQIASVIYCLYSINAPGHYVLFSVGEAKTNAVVTLSSAVASLGLIFIGARYFGLLGAVAGNAGYMGTLLMNALGLRRIEVSLHRYFTWIAPPLIALAAALFVGSVLDGHFGRRVVFIILQAGFLLFWYFRTQTRAEWMRFAFGSAPQS